MIFWPSEFTTCMNNYCSLPTALDGAFINTNMYGIVFGVQNIHMQKHTVATKNSALADRYRTVVFLIP